MNSIPSRSRRIQAVVCVLALVTTLAACVGTAPSSGRGPGTETPETGSARAQALAVLSNWAAAAASTGAQVNVIPIGDLNGQVGTWEEAVGDNNKRALMAGAVTSLHPLSEEAPPDGEVRFAEGMVTSVRLLAPRAALAAMSSTTEAGCDDCAPLLVTDARLTSAAIQTTRGPATAPVWEFAVQGTAVKITRVAIANPVVVEPMEGAPSLGLSVEAASGSASGTELTVAFTGAPKPANEPCGEDYTAEAVESEGAVVVIVTRHGRLAIEACAAVGARRTAIATLAAPLGGRAVLDLLQGIPVTVVLAP